jgi:release factor glutamine methyltransferase
MAATTVGDALGASVDALSAAGIDEPRLDAELLLGEAIGCGRAALTADAEAEVPAPAARRFGEMVRRRLRREPVAYILGRKGFRRIELEVDPRVLIPRPETELLVELALELGPARVLDVGTGSGAIALAVADELPDCEVTATDASLAALEVARANASRLGLADRVRFIQGTLPEQGGFDLILANLPYVAERDWPSLQPEVTRWEPPEALLAGPDGLDAYRRFIPECAGPFNRYASEKSAGPFNRYASKKSAGPLNRYAVERTGALAVEVGEGQAPAVAGLMRGAGFGGVETRRDLAGIERVVVGRW